MHVENPSISELHERGVTSPALHPKPWKLMELFVDAFSWEGQRDSLLTLATYPNHCGEPLNDSRKSLQPKAFLPSLRGQL